MPIDTRSLLAAVVLATLATVTGSSSALAKISAMSGAYDGKPQTKPEIAKRSSPKAPPRKRRRHNH